MTATTAQPSTVGQHQDRTHQDTRRAALTSNESSENSLLFLKGYIIDTNVRVLCYLSTRASQVLQLQRSGAMQCMRKTVRGAHSECSPQTERLLQDHLNRRSLSRCNHLPVLAPPGTWCPSGVDLHNWLGRVQLLTESCASLVKSQPVQVLVFLAIRPLSNFIRSLQTTCATNMYFNSKKRICVAERIPIARIMQYKLKRE